MQSQSRTDRIMSLLQCSKSIRNDRRTSKFSKPLIIHHEVSIPLSITITQRDPSQNIFNSTLNRSEKKYYSIPRIVLNISDEQSSASLSPSKNNKTLHFSLQSPEKRPRPQSAIYKGCLFKNTKFSRESFTKHRKSLNDEGFLIHGSSFLKKNSQSPSNNGHENKYVFTRLSR